MSSFIVKIKAMDLWPITKALCLNWRIKLSNDSNKNIEKKWYFYAKYSIKIDIYIFQQINNLKIRILFAKLSFSFKKSLFNNMDWIQNNFFGNNYNQPNP